MVYPRFDPLEFDGSLFRAMDAYRREMLEAVDRLRCDIAACKSLGDIVTPDVIAQGRAVIKSIDVRNQNPFYPPVFLTYQQNLEWIVPTDGMLTRMKSSLARKPKTYRAFVADACVQPMGGLFELNVWAALDDAFGGAESQPHLPGSRKLSDIRIVVDEVSIFVEATVLDEFRHWKNARIASMQSGKPQPTFGPGPAVGAFRVVSKVAKESMQTAANAPNIICLSFFDSISPIPPARQWAIDDLWLGGPTYGGLPDGSRLDLSRVPNIDSIFEFSRDTLLQVHVNPNANPSCRLTDDQRSQLRSALSRKLLIR